MIDHLPTLVQLIRHLQQVPYLASKDIYRVVDYMVALEPYKVEQLCKAILDAKNNIIKCAECCSWQEKSKSCTYCTSPKRDRSIICVVETWQELLSIEKTAGYNGVYHVLGGVISPLDGVGPEDLTINHLIQRINETTKEVILATNQTPEGEATAAFIASKLKKHHITLTCLARGIPVGSSLKYVDKITVYKALSERRPF
jgi:recombination protein RecR